MSQFSICIFQFTIRNAYDPTTFPFNHLAALNPMTTPPLPEQIEVHRDRMWRRDEDLRVERAVDAERFIEDVGFANTLIEKKPKPGSGLRFVRFSIKSHGEILCEPGSPQLVLAA